VSNSKCRNCLNSINTVSGVLQFIWDYIDVVENISLGTCRITYLSVAICQTCRRNDREDAENECVVLELRRHLRDLCTDVCLQITSTSILSNNNNNNNNNNNTTTTGTGPCKFRAHRTVVSCCIFIFIFTN